jgi:hypothetical protein
LPFFLVHVIIKLHYKTKCGGAKMHKVLIFGLLAFVLLACCGPCSLSNLADLVPTLEAISTTVAVTAEPGEEGGLPATPPAGDREREGGGGGGGILTEGDLPDVPRYPGSKQVTAKELELPLLLRGKADEMKNADSKMYTTKDQPPEVSKWYQNELPRHGWTSRMNMDTPEGGMLVFSKGQDDNIVAVFFIGRDEGNNLTNIIIIRGEED